MGIFDNMFQLALVAIVGAAIIGMVVAVPGLAANAQSSDTPVQFPLPGETPEEEPAPGEEPLPGEEAPLPGEEPLAPEEAPTPEELTPPDAEPAPESPEGGLSPLDEAPAPEEDGAMTEEEPSGPEAEGEGKFSNSVTMSPSPDAEVIVSIEGAGMTVEDMNVDQNTTGGTSTIIVEGAFAVGSSGASEPAPEEEEPALGEEPEGLTPEEPAPAPSTPEEEGPGALPPLEEAPAPGEEAAPGEEPLAPEEPLPGEEAPLPGEESGGLTPEETESEITPTQFPAPAPPAEEEPAPGEEAPVPEEEPFPAPAPAPAPAEEPSLTPEEPTLEAPEEDGAITEEPSDEDEMKPERTLEEGFFNAVTFSPAEGSWVSVAIEGTGMTVQGMSVNQMMEGEDTFRLTVEVTLAHEGAIVPGTTTPEAPIEPGLPGTVTPEGVPTTPAVASLTVTPSTAAAGAPITIEGTGFEATQQVNISIDGAATQTQPTSITADPEGNFVAVVIIPDGTAPGDHEISVSDSAGNSGTSSVTVEGTAGGTMPVPEAAPETAPTTPEGAAPTGPQATLPTPEETAPTPEPFGAPAPETTSPEIAPTPEELTSPEAEPPVEAEPSIEEAPAPGEEAAPAPGEETTTPETTPTIP